MNTEPQFCTWRFKQDTYVAVNNGDGWHVLNDRCENFGAWLNVKEFRRRQSMNDPECIAGLPNCGAKLSVRTFAIDDLYALKAQEAGK